jgi:hypothetical protein
MFLLTAMYMDIEPLQVYELLYSKQALSVQPRCVSQLHDIDLEGASVDIEIPLNAISKIYRTAN